MAMKVWAQAERLADATPASRNRYVDLLRAGSILAVVLGHWLIAAPVVQDGTVQGVNLLRIEPWTQYLTWVFQVMPLFFLVGGYSNMVSWRAARRDQRSYGAWLGDRLRRLVLPTVPLVLVWSVLALAVRVFGVEGDLVKLGSQAALIPLWFLAVYVMIVAIVPPTLALWDRFGVASIVGFSAAAIAVDAVRFTWDADLVGWLNFLFVWAAIHQLGYAWRDGAIGRRPLIIGLLGFAALGALVTIGTYPLSMVGVPGAPATNNSPPTVALLALGIGQTGIALALEPIAGRWLNRPRPWTTTIAINGSIMTIYLWHLTAMVLLIGASLLLGGVGLGLELGSTEWWLTRPLWVAVLVVATVPFLAVFSRFERPRRGTPMTAYASVAAAALACAGFGFIAGGGLADENVWLKVQGVVPVLAAGWLLRVGRPLAAESPSRQAGQAGRA